MKISASVNITFANEKETEKLHKLFQDAEGDLNPVSILEIFPSLVRFGSNFTNNQPSSQPYFNLTFDIIGCVSR